MALMETLEKETELFPPEVYKKVRQEVWADSTPGRAKMQDQYKSLGTPNLKQYPLRQETRKGIQSIL